MSSLPSRLPKEEAKSSLAYAIGKGSPQVSWTNLVNRLARGRQPPRWHFVNWLGGVVPPTRWMGSHPESPDFWAIKISQNYGLSSAELAIPDEPVVLRSLNWMFCSTPLSLSRDEEEGSTI